MRGKFEGKHWTCGSRPVAFRCAITPKAHGVKGMPPGTTLLRSAVSCAIGIFSRHSESSSLIMAGQGSAVAMTQVPDRSGLPFGARGAGAERLALPSLVLGTPGVGYLIHCAAALTQRTHVKTTG